MNKDFQLCQDFGTADKVRAFCGNDSLERLSVVCPALYSFVNSGRMPLAPATLAVFAEFYNPQLSAEENKRTFQVVADTLYSMIGEKREEAK